MKALRRILGDRVSGGVVAALAGYFLLLQAFVAAFTCGMTVPVEAGPRFVLCQPSQMEAGAASADEDHSGFVHECPCVVCHAGDQALLVALAPGADLGPAYTLELRTATNANDEAFAPVDPGRLGLAPAPRGPPAVSA